jgi:hypothetical protein
MVRKGGSGYMQIMARFPELNRRFPESFLKLPGEVKLVAVAKFF